MIKHKPRSMRHRMLAAMILTLVPMVILITVFFLETMSGEQRNANKVLRYTAGEISAAVDTIAGSIYNVSDAFSTDKRLIELVDRDYTGKLLEKQHSRNLILGSVFESYNRLQPQERMDALYVTTHKELFNFTDPNQNENIVLQNFARLNIDDKKKLGNFFWYPLQDNFLKSEPCNDPRRDAVIFGSRRAYSSTKSGYPYIHIFVVEEDTLYMQYKLLAEKIGAEVYILDENNALLSSTDLKAVTSRTVPTSLQQLLGNVSDSVNTQSFDKQRRNICAVRSELTGWLSVVMVPSAAITHTTRLLYIKILCAIIVCFVICGLMLVYVYRRFMEPLVQMETSIAQVDKGNLKAYVQPQGQTEMVQMMQRYNSMLDSISRHLTEKVQMETNKKDLEMQVLMNQINPHFLYNTLETIVWRAGDAGRPDIGKIAASLGKLYRLSISGGLFVSLQQELEHIQAYVNIQQSRYGDKVQYAVRLHGCVPQQLAVLKLILQPVVENCFLYGMEELTHTLLIRVSVSIKSDKLLICVSDNGCGMSRDTLELVRKQIKSGKDVQMSDDKKRRSTGIGLHNIYARLALYSETQTAINIKSKRGFGTRVELYLPKKDV